MQPATYIYLAYWVDDMLLVSNCDETRKAFEKAITDPQTGFKVTCEGPAAWFLGFQIKQHVSISEGDTDKKRTKHIAKHFHFVKEKRAAGLVVLKYLATALQVADMFTKQIFPKHFERLRRVMMGHENFDDMCERYQDAKAAGDNVDDPKLYTVKPVRPPNG